MLCHAVMVSGDADGKAVRRAWLWPSIRMSGNTAAIRIRTTARQRLGYAWTPPTQLNAARRSIKSGLGPARMPLVPGPEHDKPLESRKLNRYHGWSVVRARAI